MSWRQRIWEEDQGLSLVFTEFKMPIRSTSGNVKGGVAYTNQEFRRIVCISRREKSGSHEYIDGL